MGPKGKSGGGGKGKSTGNTNEKGKAGGQSVAVGGGKKGKGETKAPVMTEKQSKAAKKKEREERERQRIAERDEMMDGMPSYDSDENIGQSYHEEFPGVSKKKAKDLTTDKFGNTVSKKQLEEEKRIEEMRAAARARREAKGLEKPNELIGENKYSSLKESTSSGADLDSKMAQGLKLTHSEKKALKSQSRHESDMKMPGSDAHLASFSLSLQPQRGVERRESNEEGSTEWQTASATDVIIPCFTMTAPGKNLLLDASLRIVSGRRYGVMGSNGCGKTTLLHFLAARRFPIPNGVDVLMVQQEVAASSTPIYQQVLEADVQRVRFAKQLEDLEEEFGIQDSIAEEEGDIVGGITKWTDKEWEAKLSTYELIGSQWEASGAEGAEARVRRILTGLGFPQNLQEEGSEKLSGGWRMRVSLATALFIEPRLLLLDEPTNHLDLNAVLWLDNYLSNQWSHESTFLVVSHDADFLDSVCTDILHLDDCQINSYRGDYSAFESNRGKIWSKKEKEYQLQMKTLKEFMKGNKMSKEKAEKKTLQKLNLPLLKDKPKEYRVNFVLHAAEDDGPAIDMLDVSFGYSGKSEEYLFRNLRLKVNNHSRVAIVGPNGAGKSTLLRLLRGTLMPTSGEVIQHHRLRIGWYDQHFESLLPFESTPVAFLEEICGVTKLEARKYLGMFGLEGSRHLIRIGQLSGGQKSRVALASISLQRPNILILDEPTNHLDMESVDALIRALKVFSGGVVLVSHDARLITATECEIWVVGDSESGLRVERQGFLKYRQDVMKAIAREEELVERRALEKAAREKARREERVQDISKRRRRKPVNDEKAGSECGDDSNSDRAKAVSTIFRKFDS